MEKGFFQKRYRLEDYFKMRVISGKFKGYKIEFTKNSFTRPLKDSVKESVFNVLAHSNFFKVRVEKSKILDLYSGIGSFGIEALSRGAKKVIFIEQDKYNSKILKNNLVKIAQIDQVKVINDKIENTLKKKFEDKFDIFFLDPPFSDFNFLENLKTLRDIKIFKKDHIVIIHREKNVNDNLQNILDITIIKNYGRSKIIFGQFN